MTCSERRRAGYTLAELLITVTVASIVVTIALRGWGPLSQSTLSLKARAAGNAELRLAIDAVLADVGAAETVSRTVDGDLWIVREQQRAEVLGTWIADEDAGVLFTLADGRLTRIDLTSSQEIVVARLDTFDVTETVDEVDILFGYGSGADAFSYTLTWEL